MKVETENAAETTAKKVEEVDNTEKTAELHSAPNNETHSVGNKRGKEKKPSTPTKTLREMREMQRKTTDLIVNKKKTHKG